MTAVLFICVNLPQDLEEDEEGDAPSRGGSGGRISVDAFLAQSKPQGTIEDDTEDVDIKVILIAAPHGNREEEKSENFIVSLESGRSTEILEFCRTKSGFERSKLCRPRRQPGDYQRGPQ